MPRRTIGPTLSGLRLSKGSRSLFMHVIFARTRHSFGRYAWQP